MNVAVRSHATTKRASEHFDVLIVGAGISGIGSAYHLTKQLPGTSFVILERSMVSRSPSAKPSPIAA